MRVLAAILLLLTGGCAAIGERPTSTPASIVSLDLVSPADGWARLRFITDRPVTALHFAPALGTYRTQHWRVTDPGFRWTAEAGGERLERSDGAPFAAVDLTVEQRYRSLIKSYAPFSPFSDGGLLIYTGQYHACAALPCTGKGPLVMRISAPGRMIDAGVRTERDRLTYVSSGEGTNLYVGSRAPESTSGMKAIIDPGLPAGMSAKLATSLAASLAHFAQTYGPLSFTPQLFVSIDTRGHGDGQESTQGGTLPRQIFMHFDGVQSRTRLKRGDTDWLEWFFAHEVAHMFQRDRTGDRLGDDTHAWMHEGGADAMAAAALAKRGKDDYVARRISDAARACNVGLGKGPLTTATARDDFELHYSCGLIAAVAVDRAIASTRGGMDAFNHRFFAAVASRETHGPETWFAAARASGVPDATLALLRALTGADSARAQAALLRVAKQIGVAL